MKDRSGILLSVGTIRSLIAFSMGQFSHLIMMDIDHSIREHNRTHLDLIKSIVTNHPEDPEAQRIAYMNSQFFKENFDVFGAVRLFWKDDEQWQKITQALKENRIFVVTADLLNWKENEKLKAALQTFGDLPLTFDISNVIDYTGDTYHNLADTLYYLAFDNAESKFNEIEKHLDDIEDITKPFLMHFPYDEELKDHMVIFTALSLMNKDIHKSCRPLKLGSHEHGMLSFTYYSSPLSAFMKFLRAPIGFISKASAERDIPCSDISVFLTYGQNRFGYPVLLYKIKPTE